MVIVCLNSVGFVFSNDQLFLFVVLLLIFGVILWVFYLFMVLIFGGCCWIVLSIVSMLILCIWLGFVVQDLSILYWVFVLIVLFCGFGGGNFVLSMFNISFFYLKSQQGIVFGLNVGFGNFGVLVMQFVVLLVVVGGLFGVFGGELQQFGDGGCLWLQNVGWIWVLFIVVVLVVVWFGMNDIVDVKVLFCDQVVIFKCKYNWLMCWLYVVIFGLFIGFLVGFVMFSKIQFFDVNLL